jgi:hypothetical protein
MKIHRKIIPIAALGLALAALTPASAPAGSLLSGYGGPGQGTQAILGSTLLNGPSNGGGGGGAGSGSSGAAPGGGLAASSGRGAGGSSPRTHRHTGSGHGKSSGTAVGGGYRSPPSLTVTRASTAGSGVLGLSNSVFLLALLALAALFFTGLLTRGLAKASGTRWHAGS